MKDVHRWVQPRRIAMSRLIEVLDLLLKHGENTTRRIAVFKPVCERVREKIFVCAFFVRLQCIVKNWLKVGRCGSRVSVRHKGEVMS
jgi:hypothetical protein